MIEQSPRQIPRTMDQSLCEQRGRIEPIKYQDALKRLLNPKGTNAYQFRPFQKTLASDGWRPRQANQCIFDRIHELFCNILTRFVPIPIHLSGQVGPKP